MKDSAKVLLHIISNEHGNFLDYIMDRRCFGGIIPFLLRGMVAEDVVPWFPVCSPEFCFTSYHYFSHPVVGLEILS